MSNYDSAAARQSARAEIIAAVIALRNERIEFSDLVSLVQHHVPGATVEDVANIA
jgi:hypothetical protein